MADVVAIVVEVAVGVVDVGSLVEMVVVGCCIVVVPEIFENFGFYFSKLFVKKSFLYRDECLKTIFYLLMLLLELVSSM